MIKNNQAIYSWYIWRQIVELNGWLVDIKNIGWFFVKKRNYKFIASHIIVFYGRMCAFVPRRVKELVCVFGVYLIYLWLTFYLQFIFSTKKTGGLTNISYSSRKLEPLGTEYKNIVGGYTVWLLWLEIQEVNIQIKNNEFKKTIGSTAACTMRGTKIASYYEKFSDNVELMEKRCTFSDS